MIIINIFGKDAIIGDFQLSDYGLILASFENTNSSDEELGMKHETIEEYIGHNPVPLYLGSSFNSKLKPTATLVKDPCINANDIYFTEHECREVLRQLTGFRGYKQMQIFSHEFDELLFFNVRVTNVRYQYAGGRIAGIILDMECDSQFAWSSDFNYTFDVNSFSNNLVFFNTSDNLYNYSFPTVTIKSNEIIPELTITNMADNNWTTTIKSLDLNEIITMDCQNKIITSSQSRIISNDFNMHFIRLVPGKNEFAINNNIQISFKFKVPRKVGFVL